MRIHEDIYINHEQNQIPFTIKAAFWDQLASSAVDGHDNLLPLDVYMLCKRFTHIRDVGVKTVTVDQIRGQVGHRSDFDESFMPRQEYIRQLWTSEDRTRFHDMSSPLVQLLKIGANYFVLDGHHGLSLTTIYQQQAIKAHVIEVEQAHDC